MNMMKNNLIIIVSSIFCFDSSNYVQCGCVNMTTCQYQSIGPAGDQWCSPNFWLCLDKANYLCRECPSVMPYWDSATLRCKNTTCINEKPLYMGTNQSAFYNEQQYQFIIMSPNFPNSYINSISNAHPQKITLYLTTSIPSNLTLLVFHTGRQDMFTLTDIFTGATLKNYSGLMPEQTSALDSGVYQLSFTPKVADADKFKGFALKLDSAIQDKNTTEENEINPSHYIQNSGEDLSSVFGCVNSYTCQNKTNGPTEDIFCSNYFWLCMNGANLQCKKCPPNQPYWDSFNNKCSTRCTKPTPYKLCSDHSATYNNSQYRWLIDSPNFPSTYGAHQNCYFYLTTTIPSNLTSSKFEIPLDDFLDITNVFTGKLVKRYTGAEEWVNLELNPGVYTLKFISQETQGRNYYYYNDSYHCRHRSTPDCGFRLHISSNII